MTSREKRLWVLAASLLVLIYSTLYIVRGPIEYLRARNLLRLVVAAIFVLAALWLLKALWRRRPGRRELAVLAVFAGAYLWALWLTERPEERLHLLEYGVLGGLVYAALGERARRRGAAPVAGGWWSPVVAILIVGLCGWGDEGIQYLLPNRVYELRDAGLNLGAAALAVGAMHFAALARRRDRA